MKHTRTINLGPGTIQIDGGEPFEVGNVTLHRDVPQRPDTIKADYTRLPEPVRTRPSAVNLSSTS